jgi:hypothetical protein
VSELVHTLISRRHILAAAPALALAKPRKGHRRMSTPLNKTVSATVAANGTASVRLDNLGARKTTVEQVSVTGTGTGSADIFLNQTFVCASAAGAQDTASDSPPIKMTGADSLTVAWAGMTAGTTVSALFLGEIEDQ